MIGARSAQKAILTALLTPYHRLREMQGAGDVAHLMALQEELKGYAWGAVWDEFCRRQNVPEGTGYIKEIARYETQVLSNRT